MLTTAFVRCHTENVVMDAVVSKYDVMTTNTEDKKDDNSDGGLVEKNKEKVKINSVNKKRLTYN